MRNTLTQNSPLGQKTFAKTLRAKLYPNGECCVYVLKTKPVEKPLRRLENPNLIWFKLIMTCIKMRPETATDFLSALGLSHHRNSDSLNTRAGEPIDAVAEGVKRYGLKGITSYGARKVRCAAHLLEKTYNRGRIVLTTVTIPSLPLEYMHRLHENWHQFVETYRRKLTRVLKQYNLRGEVISVSEVQEKRYKGTGLPVLHIHALFVNKTRQGQWVVTPELHDQIIGDSLSIVLRAPIGQVSSAGKIERVRKSCEGYLGKYMTKGAKCIREMAKCGFDGWVPKQWWSCSRTLSQRVDYETRDVSDIAQWLDDIGDVEGADFWVWKHDVYLEFDDSTKFRIARYGRLNKRITAELQGMARVKFSGKLAY